MSTENNEMMSEELFRKGLDLVSYTDGQKNSYVLSHLQINVIVKEAKEQGLVKKTYKERLDDITSQQHKNSDYIPSKGQVDRLNNCCDEYEHLILELLEKLEDEKK